MINANTPKPAGGFRALLVGGREQDFSTLCDLLAEEACEGSQIEHIASCEEALISVAGGRYDMIVVEHEQVGEMAMRLLAESRKQPVTVPFIFLVDRTDDAKATEALNAGACDYLEKSQLNATRLGRAIRCATTLHHKELECEEREEAFRKLSRAVEQSADLVTITDRNGMIEYVNPAFEQLTGYGRDEVIGSTPRILKSEEHGQEFYDCLWSTILSGRVFRGTLVDRKKNGERFYVKKTITPIRDDEGRITHFVGTDRDITERYKLEAQLLQAQKMDAVGHLAGGVAHDFNNFLMVIRSYAELMQDFIGPEDSLRHNIDQIIKAADRAADLTRQLLAFGRKQMQRLQVVDLNQTIGNVTRLLPHLIGEDVQLTVAPGSGPNPIKADPLQLEQIVMNLATNARDAMPSGGKLTIETSSVQLDDSYVQSHQIVPPGHYALLCVSDSGRGIRPEHLPHIFEPFYTTKEQGQGTGLGLATVYGIVKQNGGFIWAYSEPGMGTNFKIYWPQIQSEETRPISEPHSFCPARGTETILLVEDEEPVRRATYESLTRWGYTVLEAKDGLEALEVARAHPGTVDLLISDVVMPRMSGGDLARQLTVERPSTKVLFVSGYAQKTVMDHGVVDPLSNFLQKPFALKTLALKIQEVLGSGKRLPA